MEATHEIDDSSYEADERKRQFLRQPAALTAYDLSDPPLRATTFSHAATITRHAFGVEPRTIEGWPVFLALVNGRRQPLVSEVWAVAMALLPEEDRGEIESKMSDDLLKDVLELLPSALDIVDDWSNRKRKNLRVARQQAA